MGTWTLSSITGAESGVGGGLGTYATLWPSCEVDRPALKGVFPAGWKRWPPSVHRSAAPVMITSCGMTPFRSLVTGSISWDGVFRTPCLPAVRRDIEASGVE